MALVMTGTGPAHAPDPGCACARCRRDATGTARAPLALRFPDGRVLDAGSAPGLHGGVLWAPAGRFPAVDPLAGSDPVGSDPVEVVVVSPAEGDRTLSALGHALGRARAAGTIGPGTRTVLAGLTHDHPGPERLAPLLAAWGLHRPDDGADLDDLAPLPRISGRTLVLGGASSGKSAFAELLLAAEPEVTYLATGAVPDSSDPDWTARIRSHRERRPAHWLTVETPDAASAFESQGPILLDSVGTWLAAALDGVAAWDQAPGWRERLAGSTDALVAAWRARRAPLVAVSDEVGLGVVPHTPAGRIFREELGRLNARLAEESDRVVLVIAGVPTDIMGP